MATFYDKIHLSISLNHNYLYNCIVYLTSLLNNKNKSTFYMIHVLIDNSIKKESKIKINKIIKKFGEHHVELKYYNLEGDFKGATTKLFPLSTYYRISLPSILPYIDKNIYTDIDVINLADLTEMYNIEFKEKMYFCASLDYNFMINEIKQFGINITKYINSGILLINLKKIRKDGIEKKIREFISKYELPFADQTAINAVCNNNIQILSYKYGLFAKDTYTELVNLNANQDKIYRFNESELKSAYNEPVFFHYFDWTKPFFKNNCTAYFSRVYWWYYAKMSGFYKNILDFYNFTITEIEQLIKQIPEDGGILRRNYKKLT